MAGSAVTITYLPKFMPNAQYALQPLTVLPWSVVMGQDTRGRLSKGKEAAVGSPRPYFDAEQPTVVSADASSYGLVGVPLQKHGEQWRPVAYCSRMLTKAKQRWAQIEDCMAAVWACQRFHTFVRGIEFELHGKSPTCSTG